MTSDVASISKAEPKKVTGIEKLANVFALLILITGVGLFAIRNLGNRYFWSDESTSLFTVLGWPPVEKFDNLSTVFGVREGHVEPGMFNLLERYWALWVGVDIVSLRTLPFLIFIVYIAALLLLARKVGAPWFLGCAVVGFMLLENITPYYAVELRPSVAGLAATVVLPLAAIWLTFSRSIYRASLVYVVIFIFFGSMQYNSFPIIIAVAALLLVASLKEPDRKKKVLLFGLSLFSILWLPFMYVLQMGNPFDLVGGDYFSNIPNVYIPNMPLDQALRTILNNFFSLTALPRTLFILLLPLTWAFKKFPFPTRESSKIEWGVNAVWITVFFGTAVSFVAGVLGVLPWVLGTRWSISEVGLIALSLVGLAGLLSQSKFFHLRSVFIGTLILSLLVGLSGAYRVANYERTPGFNWNSTFQELLSGAPGGAYVDNWNYWELRYWINYSGQYDEFRDKWIDSEIQTVGATGKADVQDIERFFASDADRLLLRSGTLLEGVQVPSDIRIMPVAPWGEPRAVVSEDPVLLVRD